METSEVVATPHYLGHCSGSRVRMGGTSSSPEVHHVFAIWIDGIDVDTKDYSLLGALKLLHEGKYQCPQCGEIWPMDRQWGCIQSVRESSPRVVKVSDTCRKCGANVHFDGTPLERRKNLTWIKMYDQRDELVGDRRKVYPCPWE